MVYVDKSNRMTVSPLADAHEIGPRNYSSPSGAFGSEQFYSPHFLRLKNFSSKFETCLDKELDTRGVEGASTTDRTMEETKYYCNSTDESLT
jgi:hypothetical protein